MRGIIEREERNSQPLYIYNDIYSLISNPNDGTSSFIKKIRITSCKIIKLSLTCVLEFHGLRSFQARSFLHCASPSHHSALSLRVIHCLYASEYSSEVIPNCYYGVRLRHCLQPETLNSFNLHTRVLHTLLRDLQ